MKNRFCSKLRLNLPLLTKLAAACSALPYLILGPLRPGCPARRRRGAAAHHDDLWMLLGTPTASLNAAALALESVLAGRKPLLLFRFVVVLLLRLAAPAFCGLLFHEPPRTTRSPQAGRQAPAADQNNTARQKGTLLAKFQDSLHKELRYNY